MYDGWCGRYSKYPGECFRKSRKQISRMGTIAPDVGLSNVCMKQTVLAPPPHPPRYSPVLYHSASAASPCSCVVTYSFSLVLAPPLSLVICFVSRVVLGQPAGRRTARFCFYLLLALRHCPLLVWFPVSSFLCRPMLVHQLDISYQQATTLSSRDSAFALEGILALLLVFLLFLLSSFLS